MRGLAVSRLAMIAVSAVGLACSGANPPTTSSPHVATSPPRAQLASGGCGSTQARVGAVPAWLDAAAGHNLPQLPYVIAVPDSAAGFLFARPLRAGRPENPANKILWVVRTPREGSPLEVDGHPLGTDGPIVHQSQPADSFPGEIYPSIIDAPTSGCWHFTLQWATGRAEVDLNYV
jgi:hypothetical protein